MFSILSAYSQLLNSSGKLHLKNGVKITDTLKQSGADVSFGCRIKSPLRLRSSSSLLIPISCFR